MISDKLVNYGFRGEALSSLCSVSSLSIITKKKENSFGHIYIFDHDGNITSKQPTATTPGKRFFNDHLYIIYDINIFLGTTIIVKNLFKKLPVRRQYYSNEKRLKEEFKKIESLLMAYSIIFPKLHIALYHDR